MFYLLRNHAWGFEWIECLSVLGAQHSRNCHDPTPRQPHFGRYSTCLVEMTCCNSHMFVSSELSSVFQNFEAKYRNQKVLPQNLGLGLLLKKSEVLTTLWWKWLALSGGCPVISVLPVNCHPWLPPGLPGPWRGWVYYLYFKLYIWIHTHIHTPFLYVCKYIYIFKRISLYMPFV